MRLIEGEANLGVLSHETVQTGLDIQEFFEDSISLIVPKNHKWENVPFITPDDLINEPLIIREPSSGTRKVMLGQFAKYDIVLDDLNIFLELGNAEAIVESVAAGYGVAFVWFGN
jgi:DNA-binding transcriptional LysR family regulator